VVNQLARIADSVTGSSREGDSASALSAALDWAPQSRALRKSRHHPCSNFPGVTYAAAVLNRPHPFSRSPSHAAGRLAGASMPETARRTFQERLSHSGVAAVCLKAQAAKPSTNGQLVSPS
jgi:hypothetical protein